MGKIFSAKSCYGLKSTALHAFAEVIRINASSEPVREGLPLALVTFGPQDLVQGFEISWYTSNESFKARLVLQSKEEEDSRVLRDIGETSGSFKLPFSRDFRGARVLLQIYSEVEDEIIFEVMGTKSNFVVTESGPIGFAAVTI